MKNFRIVAMMLIVMLTAVCFNSCGDDDVNDVIESNDFVLGTWRSYKVVGYVQGEKAELSVSKNGENSAAYIELTFEKNGTVVGYSWKQDENGVSSWTKETGNYTVNNGVVNLTFGNETSSLMYDKNERALYLRGVSNTEYGAMTIYIYLKK